MKSEFRRTRPAFAMAIVLFTNFLCSPAIQATEESPPGQTPVSDQLFLSTSDDMPAVVLFRTDNGVMVSSPASAEQANTLADALQQHWNLPITHVYLAHAGDGQLAAADALVQRGAILVAHDAAAPALAASGLSAITFSDTLTLRDGDDYMTLHYPGSSFVDDAIYAHFPEQKAVFAGSIVAVSALPDRDLASTRFSDWFAAIDHINRVDFVYLLTADGAIGIQQDARDHGYFLRTLKNRVRRAVEAGLTKEEILANTKMPRYQTWAHLDAHLPVYIEAVYRDVTESDS